VRIYRDLNKIEEEECVATIGIFDGVHNGHKHLFSELKQKAKELNKETAVITFWPHPKIVLQKDNSTEIRFLTTIEEKIDLIDNFGIDNLYIIPFTQDFAKISAFDFMYQYLFQKMHISHLIIGHNQTIGNERERNLDNIKEYSIKCNFSVSTIDSKLLNDKKISSSKIREYISNGEIELANEFLGYNFFINGTVVHGDQIGRKIDFPTANVRVNHPYKLIPQQGVYAVLVKINGIAHKGMMNVGTRPTVTKSTEVVLEVNLFDFNEEIYRDSISIELIKQIRTEKHFNSLQELKDQLINDKIIITEILNNYNL